MQPLFDQNLSPHLCRLLTDVFPVSAHVRDFNLQHADDIAIWEFARNNNYTIVSKDSDFHQRSFLHGHPPKVVWIRTGNASTQQIAAILRDRASDVEKFAADAEASFLIIS